MNPQHLDTLLGNCQRHPDRAGSTIGLLVLEHMSNETLAGMPYQQGTTQLVKPLALDQQIQVMLMAFPESYANIQADMLGIDTGINQVIPTLLQVCIDFLDHVLVMRGVLHGLRIALHMHGTQTGLTINCQR